MKNKIYAVKHGRKTGIFYSWAECEEQVKGFKGAIFKSFKTEEEAIKYLSSDNDVENVELKKSVEEELELTKQYSSNPSFLVVYTDGSNTQQEDNMKYSYGFVVVENNRITFEDCGIGQNKEAAELRNIAGELSAVMNAILYAKRNYPNRTLVIFHDYQGVSSWINGEWKAKHPLVQKYVDFVKKQENILSIQFVKVSGHQGNPFNERADELARSALGLEK